MNILLAYETYSSGTESAASFASDVLSSHNHIVVIKKAHTLALADFAQYDLILLASPSWWVDEKDGQPHINYKKLFENVKDIDFTGKNFAIFGLGDASYAHFCGAVDALEKFVKDHNGNLITDSLRIDSFYFERAKNETILKDWLEKLNNIRS